MKREAVGRVAGVGELRNGLQRIDCKSRRQLSGENAVGLPQQQKGGANKRRSTIARSTASAAALISPRGWGRKKPKIAETELCRSKTCGCPVLDYCLPGLFIGTCNFLFSFVFYFLFFLFYIICCRWFTLMPFSQANRLLSQLQCCLSTDIDKVLTVAIDRLTTGRPQQLQHLSPHWWSCISTVVSHYEDSRTFDKSLRPQIISNVFRQIAKTSPASTLCRLRLAAAAISISIFRFYVFN